METRLGSTYCSHPRVAAGRRPGAATAPSPTASDCMSGSLEPRAHEKGDWLSLCASSPTRSKLGSFWHLVQSVPSKRCCSVHSFTHSSIHPKATHPLIQPPLTYPSPVYPTHPSPTHPPTHPAICPSITHSLTHLSMHTGCRHRVFVCQMSQTDMGPAPKPTPNRRHPHSQCSCVCRCEHRAGRPPLGAGAAGKEDRARPLAPGGLGVSDVGSCAGNVTWVPGPGHLGTWLQGSSPVTMAGMPQPTT